MNKRFAQLIMVMALSGTFAISGYKAVGQEVNKDACREGKKEEQRVKAMERNERWAARQEAKMMKELVNEQKFDTPATARGSEAGFYHNGEYVALGYFDKTNSFRSYTGKTEDRIKLKDSTSDSSVVRLWEQSEARSTCQNLAKLD